VVFLLNPDQDWMQGNVGLRGAVGQVISVERSGGYGGGHVSVTVSIGSRPVSQESHTHDQVMSVDASVAAAAVEPASVADLKAKFNRLH
jgi:hypothetical protein